MNTRGGNGLDKLLAWSTGGFCTFLGILLAGIGSLIWQNEVEFQGRALSTKGKVVSLISSTAGTGVRRGTVYRPVVRYHLPSGETGEIESNVTGNPPFAQVGDEVEVLYDPNNSKDVRLKADLEFPKTQIMFIGFGGIFLLVGGIVIVVGFYAET
jgi:hypothetical protein